jgi:outer membrane cobalamin receptor
MLCRSLGLSGRSASFSRSILVTFLFLVCSTLALRASAGTLRGRVVDPHARAVVGADVLVLRAGAIITRVATTADGRFGPVTLPPGRYDVLVSATGLHAAPTTVSIDKSTTADIAVAMALSAVNESVVVSASQVDVPLSRATESVTVIDRSDLDLRQMEQVADALRMVPGFGVVSNGGRGAVTSIFPRGGESDYTLVLVDGIAQNVFGGGFDAAHLSTADVDRIEVVRGPESALYGSGAIGGVVHVITRHGGKPVLFATFEGGGYGTTRESVSATGSARVWQWGGSIEHLKTGGDTRMWPSLGRRIANADYARVTGSGSFAWSDGPGRRVRVDMRADENDAGNPGPYGSNPAGNYGGLDLVARGKNHSKEVGVSGLFGGTGTTRHAAQFTWTDLTNEFAGQYGSSSDQTKRASARYQFDAAVGSLGLSAGAELLHERNDNTYITGTTFQPVPVRRMDAGLFVEARPSLGRRAFLTAGARFERLERNALEADPGSFNQRPAFGNDVVWSANPKVSAAWFVRQPESSASGLGAGWTKVRFGAGTGIKPPTGFEIAYTDNPNLKPERSRSVDLGLEQAFGSTLVADVTWFANRYDDLIVAVSSAISGSSHYRTDNIANARSRGVETGVQWRGCGGLSARGAWTWLNTAVLGIDHAPSQAPNGFQVGDPLIRRPRNQGSFDLTWSAAHASAFLSVNGRGTVRDVEPTYGISGGLFDAKGYATVSLGGSWRLKRGVEIFGRVVNALDRQYEDAFGYPALGRSASIGLRVAAGR